MKACQQPELEDSGSAQGLFAQLFSDSWETFLEPQKSPLTGACLCIAESILEGMLWTNRAIPLLSFYLSGSEGDFDWKVETERSPRLP